MEDLALPEIDQKIKLNSFAKKDKGLLLNDEIISFAGSQVGLQEITHFRFGMSALQMGMFIVGRKYQVHIKTPTTRLNFVFRSYFRISNDYFDSLFHKIINGVWLRSGDRLLAELIQTTIAGNTSKFGNCTLSKSGITLHKNAGKKQKRYLIPWNDLSYEKKYNRLVLNSTQDPRRWINLYYLDNWNVDVLIEFLDWVYKEGGLASLQEQTL